MLEALGSVLAALLLSLPGSDADSAILSREAYEKACGDSTRSLFESEMSKFTFPDLKVDSIAVKGLYVTNVTVLPIKAMCIPDAGVRVHLSALLSIFGTCGSVLVPGVVTAAARLNCSALVLLAAYSPSNGSVGAGELACAAALTDVTISSSNTSVSVEKTLRSSIVSELREKAPKILSDCISIGHRKFLHRINSVIPFEMGKIVYVPRSPRVHNSSVEIPLQVQYETSDGRRIPIPSLPASPEVTLVANGTAETVGENTFTTVLSRVVFEEPRTIPCTPETFSQARALEDALNDTIASKCPACPAAALSLLVLVEALVPLEVHLDVSRCALNVSLRLEIMSKSGNESLAVLAVLEAELGLAAAAHAAGSAVRLSAALDSLVLAPRAPASRSAHIQALQEPLRAFVQEVIVNEINSYLKTGKIPVFKIPGLPFGAVACRPAQRCIVCHNYHKKEED